MIKNVTTFEEFEMLGLQCLSKAFEMNYQLGNKYKEIAQDEVMGTEITPKTFWKHNDISVRTSFIVLFQGIEYLMKMRVAKESPLLLIDNNKNDWPTLSNRKDKNFDELQTISGDNLLSVFCAVSSNIENLNVFEKKFNDVRVKRNKLVHSTGVDSLDYKYVIVQIFYFLAFFYDNYKWLGLFRTMFVSDPTFGYWDWNVEGAEFHMVLDFIEDTLSKNEYNKYLPVDIKSRRYLCPDCTHWLNKDVVDKIEPRWTFLTPNTPISNKVKCLICDKEYKVEREACKSCYGNVIYTDGADSLCLSCYGLEEQ